MSRGKKPKSPAFQFYANDWLSSTRIAMMTPAQEGAYIRLLCHAWNDPECSLPDDDAQLAVLSRMGDEWLKGGSDLVRKCFTKHKRIEHRLVNERLLIERKKQRNHSLKSREGGLRSGEARRSGTKGTSSQVQPKRNQKPTLQSSSSSSPSGFNSRSDQNSNKPPIAREAPALTLSDLGNALGGDGFEIIDRAEEIFGKAGYRGTDGRVFWQAAILEVRRKLAPATIASALRACELNAKGNPPAYFATVIAEECQKTGKDFKALAKAIEFPRGMHFGPPPRAAPSDLVGAFADATKIPGDARSAAEAARQRAEIQRRRDER